MTRLIFLIILLLCSSLYFLPALADDPLPANTTKSTLVAIDRELMLKLIDLARFNIHFHHEANHHQRWRNWSYPLAREAGTSLSLSNTLTDLSARAEGLDNPKNVSRTAVLNGNICGTIGAAVSASASSLELVQNGLVQLHAHSLGYTSHASVMHVLSEVNEIDQLRQRREEIVKHLTKPNERRVRTLEAIVFHEIEEQLLFEFRKWNCYSRELTWRENVFYSIDAAQNFTSMTSAILSVAANSNRQLRGPSAITALIAASGATVSPIIAEAAGTVMDRYQRRKLSKYFPLKKPVLPADVSLDTLNALRSGKKSEEDIDLSHISLLTSKALGMDQALEGDIRAIHRLRAVAQQQLVPGTLIGLTSVTRATITTVADYSYPNNARKSDRLLFAGRIPQAVGQSCAIVITAGTQMLGMKKDRELRQRQALPSQIFDRRLKDLDELEAFVRSDKF